MGLKGRWRSWVAGLKERSPRLHRFLAHDQSPYPVLREAALFGAILLLGGVILWGATGQPLGDSPVVVVESGSMMHCTNGMDLIGRSCESERYGRIGTIDPGDLIFVKDIDGAGDVERCRDMACSGGHGHYGKPGDVIIFRPDGNRQGTPVIHRALLWLEIHGDAETFTIAELGLFLVTSLDQPSLQALGLEAGYHFDLRALGAGPEDSGFITRGDNNGKADQDLQGTVAKWPVKPGWILGVARGEVPWLGLVKLKFNDIVTGADHYADAPTDVKRMLLVSLALLLGGPYVAERVVTGRRRRKEGAEGPGPPGHT